MEKYFRTKDGRIIDFTRLFIAMAGRKPHDKETVGLLTYVPIVKESYDIEELCDEIVSVSKEDGMHMFHTNGKPHYSKVDDIYGAIWTDTGLIYVAKLNEKGEWELL